MTYRAAILMGALCGENQAEGAELTTKEANDLAQEAYQFVTSYMAALFGAAHTTKMHRLAYHLLDALLPRGNLVEGDTSMNECCISSEKSCTPAQFGGSASMKCN